VNIEDEKIAKIISVTFVPYVNRITYVDTIKF